MQKHKPPFRSITNYLFQYFIPLIAVSLILDILALFIAGQWSLERNKYDLDLASTALSNYVNQIVRFAFDISVNENVQSLLLSDKSPYISAFAQAEAFDRLIGLNRYYDLEIVHIEVSTPDNVNILGVGYLPVRSMEDEPISLAECESNNIWIYPGNVAYYDRTQRNYNILSFYQKVLQLTSNRYIGYVRIDVNVDVLSDFYKPLNSLFRQQLYLIQDNETIPVFANGKINTQEASKGISLFRGSSISNTIGSHFILTSWFRLSHLLLSNSSIIILFVVEILFFIVFFIVMHRFIRQLVSPLFLLNNAIQDKSPSGGRLSKLNCSEGSREIKVIYDGFNQMVDSINEYVETNRKIIQAEQTTRTLYFQSQINPHFLYNTLDTLRWISLSAGDTIVANEIYRLSSIYRYYLNPGDALIRVKEEVELIHNYMDLQKLRFKDKFHFQVNIQEIAENIKIPKLLIQPLVENSVEHGFSDLEENCTISLSIQFENRYLQITVKDNGCGMDADMLRKIAKDSQIQDGSFALANIRKRLNLYYGEAASMTIRSKQSLGTDVVITIPVSDIQTENSQ